MQTVFLDRDGVINENRVDHVKSWREFVFLPGALAALRWLNLAGFRVFVITNQAIVGRGIVPTSVVEEIHARMQVQVALHGGQIHDIRYCPHDDLEHCDCRKPRPGMLRDLAHRWNVDLSRAYLVGDAWSDIAAGHAMGIRSILVRTGRGAQQITRPELRQYPPDHIANDLLGAVAWMMHREEVALAHRGAAQPSHERAVGTPLFSLQ
ncbi:D-glycero-alpha-D-manno-heptose-1,7-bisphosphate 7-phosphatase [Roseiflexus sp.]|uniref:D-glycero-alpha-D-manno-heptose-1,7-bisphosphate 7-phosphatase n=1 Tax=Roseiflexus sp. TaxID=2562120 RepID=UPI00398B2A14